VLTLSAFVKDWAGCNVHGNHCQKIWMYSSFVVIPHSFNIPRPWVDPLIPKAALWLVLVHHLVGHADVKSLKPRQGGPRDDPSLASIKKNGLDDSLVELRGDKSDAFLL
jgi:hypothetical protein